MLNLMTKPSNGCFDLLYSLLCKSFKIVIIFKKIDVVGNAVYGAHFSYLSDSYIIEL